MPSSNCHHLLSLPAEIRLNIYDEYLAGGISVSPRFMFSPNMGNSGISFTFELPQEASILLTCRQVYFEASGMLWKNVTLNLKATKADMICNLFAQPSLLSEKGIHFSTVEMTTELIYSRLIKDPGRLLAYPLPPASEFCSRETDVLPSFSITTPPRLECPIPVLRCFDKSELCLLETRSHVLVLMRVIMACEFMDDYPFIGTLDMRMYVDKFSGKGRLEAQAYRALGLLLGDRIRDDSVAAPIDDRYGLSLGGVQDGDLVLSIVRKA